MKERVGKGKNEKEMGKEKIKNEHKIKYHAV